jgi:hypothetical protein
MKAFPLFTEKQYCQLGMELRDYFAAKAMQGDISRYENKDNPEYWTTEAVAQRSYAMADAMIKAREA